MCAGLGLCLQKHKLAKAVERLVWSTDGIQRKAVPGCRYRYGEDSECKFESVQVVWADHRNMPMEEVLGTPTRVHYTPVAKLRFRTQAARAPLSR